MELIYDFDSCKNVIDIYRKNRAITNCFFMQKKIKEIISEKRLFILRQGDNLLLFEKEQSFFRMYYFINDIDTIELVKSSDYIVVELPFNRTFSDECKLQNEILRRMGFRMLRKSARMVAHLSDINFVGRVIKDNILINNAKKEDFTSIIDLLYKTFDIMFAFLPTQKQLSELIEQKKIWVCYSEGELAGIINIDVTRNVAWIRHIVIVEKFRGKGIGGVLLNWFHTVLKNKVNRFVHWVDMSNTIAIKMYIKAGYSFDGRISYEYSNIVK